jgi:hypothetical protein
MKQFLLTLALCGLALPLHAQTNVWHQGKIEYPHSLAPIAHGVVPVGTHLILDDGTNIDVSALEPDDVFNKLVHYWSTERTDYRAAPPWVDQFMFRIKGSAVEIRYTANNTYGRRWTGNSHAIK